MKSKVLFFVITLLHFSGNVLAFTDKPIGQMLKAKEPVRVYIKDFKISADQTNISSESLKRQLEDILRARKTLKFFVAADLSASDIQIECDIKKYQYLDQGPLKVTPSATMMAIDVVQTVTGNYAEMTALFRVTEAGTNRLLWEDTIETYIKRPMAPEESAGLIYGKVLKSFVRKCFGKPLSRTR